MSEDSQPPTPPSPPTSGGLPKAYNPASVEKAITARWDAARAFHADPQRVLNSAGTVKPYSILIPPPNVTAALHLGHALNNTLQDVLIRAHRMMGFETLWMPGTDHAGIATQAVVEKRVFKDEGKRRADFTRDEFVAKIQAFKDEYEATITQQLKDMGCSCDWDRQRFTMDEQCAAAVREAFFRLFRDGLIYRGKRLVNWDPVLQTAVADDEVEDIEIVGNFYYLRYPLVARLSEPGASGLGSQSRATDPTPITWSELTSRGYPGADQHPPTAPAWITVATTRPETYLGDTAVAINPSDPRAASLKGLSVRLPLVGRVIPILEDAYVVLPKAHARTPEEAADPKAEFATGFLKVTPAHDPNDYELGQRHNLPMINIMAPDASISDKHGWSDIGEAHLFVGKSREDARKLVVKEFKALTIGAESALEGIKPYRHSVKHSDRSKAAIEYYLSDQWYCKVTDPRLAETANAALVPDQRTLQQSPLRKQGVSDTHPTDHTLRFYPARYAKTYESWHDNIRDWCISRQLWWGHRIPVWTMPVGKLFSESEWDTHVDKIRSWKNEDRIALLEHPHEYVDYGGVPSGKYVKMLKICVRRDDDSEVMSELISQGYFQDPDVLDTWFSSALWPLSTMGWPDPAAFNADSNEGLLQAFNPTSVLCTAREIITLWVSRMVMFNRYFLGSPALRAGSSTSDAHQHDPAQRAGLPNLPGPAPFSDVFIHAMIQDGEGRKMSKSLGNGVDPRDITASHGSDAMRFTLVQMTTQTQDVRMPVVGDEKTGLNTSPKFDAGRNFVNKLWNASRYALSIFERNPAGTGAEPSHISTHRLSLPDRWLLSRLAQTTRSVETSLKNYEFSDYAESLYKLLWWDFCDWYLEAIKSTVDADPAQRAVLRAGLDTILRLLHPIAPFVTEAIHEHLRPIPSPHIEGVTLTTTDLLCRSGWPILDASLIDPAAEREFDALRSLITAIREVRAQHQVPPKRRITLHAPSSLAARCAAAPGLVEQLAGLESILTTPPPPATPGATQPTPLRHDGIDLHLTNLADAIDAGAERERLERQLAELEKAATTLDKRLSSPGYAQKAPAKLVEDSTNQLARTREEIHALKARLATP